MGQVKILAPFIFKAEGGFVNDPNDKGKATNMGVTINTFKAHGFDNDNDGDIDVNDLKRITLAQATSILKSQYWDKCSADNINNQAIANAIVDWYWHSYTIAIKITQRLLGLKQDGIIGNITIKAINNAPATFLPALYAARLKFLNDIVANNPSQQKFLKGWLNRLNDLKEFNKQFNV